MTFYVYLIWNIFKNMVMVWFMIRVIGYEIKRMKKRQEDKKYFVQINDCEWVEKSYYEEHKYLYSKI